MLPFSLNAGTMTEQVGFDEEEEEEGPALRFFVESISSAIDMADVSRRGRRSSK